MAQLTDDCFAGSDALLPLHAALAELTSRLTCIAEPQQVPLRAALDRILAAAIVAQIDVPPHDNAAVDGYAVAFDDLSPTTPTTLAIAGRAAAGHPFAGPLGPRQVVRIFTGAPMPTGPDTVLMQEDCTSDGETVTILPGITRGANRRHKAEDVRAGDAILHPGRRLGAADLGLVASIGLTELNVFKPLRVAVFSTGDEVVEPGAGGRPGTIYDANRHALLGALETFGCTTSDLGILPDDRPTIAGALSAAAASHDVIVTSGGMSQGDEDHVAAAVGANGQLHFWRLAIKPGRPVAMGQIDGTVFLGLPGNPAAMMVTFFMLVRPALQHLSGATAREPARFQVTAGFSHRKKPGRTEFVRATLSQDGPDVRAIKYPHAGAGILRSIVESDGLVELSDDVTQITPGTPVPFIPYTELRR